MKLNDKMYTVESVLKGHPDKICDQISDGLLDLYLEKDINSHTAIECLGNSKGLVVAGEIDSKAFIEIEKNCQFLYNKITGLSSIKVINLVSQQASQLKKAIERNVAGDQGIMYGYACDTPSCNYLPLGYWIANLISKRLDNYRENSNLFLSDGKVQVTVNKNEIIKITINVQHFSNTNMELLKEKIMENVLYDIKSKKIIINDDEDFIKGGFDNDTGLTGRKIMVDTYGGIVPHGGGAFSGKDPSKLDRSASYMCRFVAKNIVANGYAKECCISVAYEFGKEEPIMLNVEVDNSNSADILEMIKKYFDFRPKAIIECLNLKSIKYLPTATYGHFTSFDYPWEKIIKL